MKVLGIVLVAAVALLGLVLVACGDDSSADDRTSGSQTGGPGLVAPNQFLDYAEARYELVSMLFENMVPAEQFTHIGEAKSADVDLKGDMRVFERDGDSTAVYTYASPTEDDGGMWLAWRLTP